MKSNRILKLAGIGAASVSMIVTSIPAIPLIEAVSNVGVATKGDMNSDGNVTAVDFMILKSHLLGSVSLDAAQTAAADFNGDGAVNIIDGAILCEFLLGGGTVDPPADGEAAIALNGSSISVTGSGAVASGSTVTINAPGVYTVTGTLNDGQIIVDVDKDAYPDGEVELRLSGASITCSNNSPVYIASIDDKCSIVAESGTTSYLTDGASYTNPDGDSGAIYAKDDINFKGKGTLIVKGNCSDGIVGKDDIKIKNLTLEVTAADDGIRGKDSVQIESGSVKVTAGGDGIKSTEETDTEKGFVSVADGTVTIKSTGDGIDAQNYVSITGGTLDIYTYQGSGFTGQVASGSSAKAIKGVSAVTIAGGTITIDSSDDAIHSTNIDITGGTMKMASGDDGIHADTTLTIADGDINITKSYEGVEGTNIYINGGNVRITASDDGLNGAGGDGSGTTSPGGWGQGGWGPGGMGVGNAIVQLNGGYVFVNSGGDGLDSNGSLTFGGATAVVSGPTNNGNGPIDADGTITFTSGILMAVGSTGMMQSPSSGAITSASLNAEANTMVTVTDANGAVLSAFKVPKTAAGIVYANSNTTVSSCKVYSGGTYSGTLNEDGYGTGGTISGGPQVTLGTSGGRMW